MQLGSIISLLLGVEVITAIQNFFFSGFFMLILYLNHKFVKDDV